jgi:RNA polymerase sigma-B factor
MERYDLDKGVEFSTYITPTILGEIKRYFRDKCWALKIPRRLKELNLAHGRTAYELMNACLKSSAEGCGKAARLSEPGYLSVYYKGP